MNNTKTCTKCGIEKELSDFSKDKSEKFGRKSQCKQCWKNYYLEHKTRIDKNNKTWQKQNNNKILVWREKNKLKLKQKNADYFQQDKELLYQQHREWCKNNKDKVNKLSKENYYKHREKRLKKNHEDYLKNKDKLLQYSKEYYKINRIQRLEQGKEYQIKNKEHINKRAKKYYQKNKKRINRQRTVTRQNSIEIRLANNLRTRIGRLLKGNHRSLSTLKLIGCSIEFLKNHLESQFTEGMSWENYGRGWNGKGMQEWHIDHIIPFEKFNLSDEKEQSLACNYTNLQPMWALENIVKSNKI